jgi:FAD/FMN-containing dehydrogenase
MEDKRRELAAIVGEEDVVEAPEVLEQFAADRSCVARIVPRYVVRPRSAGEVQELVQWANRAKASLIPVSSGPPHSHGDTVPSVAEAVMVDLSLMKAIVKIDRRNRIVVIEPGVTYGEIAPELAAQGLRISRPLRPRSNKSVVASLLEREPTTIPRLNYSLPEPLRVCGVVWGTGEMAYTGEAGMGPLALEAQWKAGLAQVNQQGPMSTDLMRLVTGAQGTMGIVVWASIKCQLLPAVSKRFLVKAPRLEDLVEFCRAIERLKLGDEVVMLNRARLAGALDRAGDGVAPWSLLLGASGAALYPEEKLKLQEKELRGLAVEFGLVLEDAEPEVSALLDSCIEAVEHRYDLFFLATLDAAPGYVKGVLELAGQLGYAPERIGIYIQPQHQGVSQHVEFAIPYDSGDKGDMELARKLFIAASENLISQNAYFSRPYGPWADLVYGRDATATRVLRTVKQIVDPNHVMNPGKLCY